ncbi:cupin domain-containing protein [Oceanobacillus kapialis]|uniref:Cupin domain-containing protein n=2 Tax=Bacillati TaxID=1783272 RepID=A0ABW5PZA9_9BACI
MYYYPYVQPIMDAPPYAGYPPQFTYYPVNRFYPVYYEGLTSHLEDPRITLRDYGQQPLATNIEKATKRNSTFRTALWTGDHLQVTLMSMPVGEDIGLEIHPDTDQFLRIEQGHGITEMGKRKNDLPFRRRVKDDDAIFIPAGYWHNITNIGNEPLKLYSIYAPPEHPFGTVHRTKAQAMEAESD